MGLWHQARKQSQERENTQKQRNITVSEGGVRASRRLSQNCGRPTRSKMEMSSTCARLLFPHGAQPCGGHCAHAPRSHLGGSGTSDMFSERDTVKRQCRIGDEATAHLRRSPPCRPTLSVEIGDHAISPVVEHLAT
ncbi:uncharacterized protein LOC144115085 isoform X2 [Amblyomma americanum]